MPVYTHYNLVAWLLAGIGLWAALHLRLLPALLAGLLIYHLANGVASSLRVAQLSGHRTKLLAIGVIATLVVGAVVAAVIGVQVYIAHEGGFSALLTKLAEILARSRDTLPPSLLALLPQDADELRAQLIEWLRAHAQELSALGTETGRMTAYVLIGMIVGAMVSLQEIVSAQARKPLVNALAERMGKFSVAFRNVVLAQTKIAATNAVLTWLYLAVLLPLAGIKLPFTATLVVLTFVAGLIPIVGNVISNTVILIVSLGHSFSVAVASLVFLAVIHKLEYFLSAKWVGTGIHASAWELLVALLVMESAFGILGLVAAPIYYAYLKAELRAAGAL